MATITVIPKKDNAKNRRLAKQMAFWDRKRAEYAAKPKSRSVEEIFDSVFGRPADETDVFAELIIGLKDAPEAPRKQPRLRKPIMQDGGITARA
ncbi:hypothetical protein ISO73_04615 [Morganella morganii subsp. morganii]|uniref:hypothetical protein n=1 Tax=Morganella morganii TaxID=582 RepID=UPI0016495623|nr:hypothetical protein [Morganella morganii]ELA8475196.1 hypothetical protein [Morganella morganii]MBC3999735.1 hypothetical protein [Morganella morganii]MBT0449550.1 hypothetical protein [Morganella morganii subsp. morganii]MBV0430541.1 hypothetical protein [Morganella morganii subsp. morganii]MDT5426097.1 hypothetical protein [Morganella morganii]